MSKSYDFLKDVYPFFVLTANNEEPNGRPFERPRILPIKETENGIAFID